MIKAKSNPHRVAYKKTRKEGPHVKEEDNSMNLNRHWKSSYFIDYSAAAERNLKSQSLSRTCNNQQPERQKS